MLEKVDQKLLDWVRELLPETEVDFAPPNESPEGAGIGLYLMELEREPMARGARRPPHQVFLRYLVTAWADTQEESHRLLGELLFAAMDSDEFQVERKPLPLEAWAAFGVKPRPSFVIRVPARQARPEPRAPLVRSSLSVKKAPVGELTGVVLGPDDLPLMGAKVDLPELQLSKETDSRGRFRFAAIPTEHHQNLRVRARGREFSISSEKTATNIGPFVIRLDDLEE